MKPEVEAILNSIGWEAAKGYNLSFAFHLWEPDTIGDKLFVGKPDAVSGLQKLDKFMKAYRDLPEIMRARLNDIMKSSNDWDNGKEPLFTFNGALFDLINQANVEKDIYWSGKGRKKNHNAYEITSHMAKIYVLGLGQMPKGGETNYTQIGQDPETKQAASKFSKAVKSVFEELDINASFRAPADAAVKMLQENDFAEYNRLIKMRTYEWRSISMFDAVGK